MPDRAGLILGQIPHRTELNSTQMPGGGGGWAVLELTGTLPQVPVMLKRRLQTVQIMQTTQTMQTGSFFYFFK